MKPEALMMTGAALMSLHPGDVVSDWLIADVAKALAGGQLRPTGQRVFTVIGAPRPAPGSVEIVLWRHHAMKLGSAKFVSFGSIDVTGDWRVTDGISCWMVVWRAE